MSPQEKKLTAALLKMAADQFSNHVCNDLPKEIEQLLTQEEWDVLSKEFHEYNGDPENHTPGRIVSYDWLWMSYMAHKISKE